jgi:hypothetical protein
MVKTRAVTLPGADAIAIANAPRSVASMSAPMGNGSRAVAPRVAGIRLTAVPVLQVAVVVVAVVVDLVVEAEEAGAVVVARPNPCPTPRLAPSARRGSAASLALAALETDEKAHE